MAFLPVIQPKAPISPNAVPPDVRGVLWRLLSFARPHRGLLARAFACMVLLGASTGAFAYLLGPALRLLLSGGAPPEGLLGKLWPRLLTLDRTTLLWTFAGVIVALGVVKGVGYLGQFY